MKNNGNSAAGATVPENSLTILREVSHAYELLRTLRKKAARAAHEGGATYQELGDALGIDRSNAYRLIHRDAA